MANLVEGMNTIIAESGRLRILAIMLQAGSITLIENSGTFIAIWTLEGHKLYANADTLAGIVDGLRLEIITYRNSLKVNDAG